MQKFRCIQITSTGLKIHFIAGVNLFLNVFQPHSSDPFKFLTAPDSAFFKYFFYRRHKMFLNLFQCQSSDVFKKF